jgi:hypothetical protein
MKVYLVGRPVSPYAQIVEFGINCRDIGFEPADELQRPVLKRRIGAAGARAVRIAHENIIFEMRPEKCHAPRPRWRHNASSALPRYDRAARCCRDQVKQQASIRREFEEFIRDTRTEVKLGVERAPQPYPTSAADAVSGFVA